MTEAEILAKYGVKPEDAAPLSEKDVLQKYGVSTENREPQQREDLQPYLVQQKGPIASLLGLTQLTEAGRKAPYNRLKEAYANKSLVDKLFTGHVPEDTESSATLSTWGGPGGAVRSLLDMALHPRGTGDYKAPKNVADFFNGPSTLKHYEKFLPYWLAKAASLPTDAALDPFASATASRGFARRPNVGEFVSAGGEIAPQVAKEGLLTRAKQFLTEPMESPVIAESSNIFNQKPRLPWESIDTAPNASFRDALLMRTPEGYDTYKPVGDAAQSAGKKTFDRAFNKANHRVRAFRDSEYRGPTEVSDIFWNKGRPTLSGKMSNTEINNAVDKNLRADYAVKRSITDSVKDLEDIAPGITSEKTTYVDDTLNNHLKNIEEGPVLKATKQANASTDVLKLMGKTDDEINSFIKETIEKARKKGQAAKEKFLANKDLVDQFKKEAEDSFSINYSKTILDKLDAPNARARILGQLREKMPGFSSEIDRAEKLFKLGSKEEAKQQISKLIDFGLVGPRSLTEIDELAAALGQKASGSKKLFKSNSYEKNARVTETDAFNMKSSGNLRDLVRNRIEATHGKEALDRFNEASQRYGAMARGATEVEKATKHAETTPLTSLVKTFLFTRALAHPTPQNLAEAVIPTTAQMLNKRPRVSIGLGNILNDLGKSNYFDQMLKQQGLLPYEEEKK